MTPAGDAGLPPAVAAWRRWLAEHWVLLLALAIVLAVGLANDLRLSPWVDEAYSLDTARRSLAGTFRQALHFELQPPLYFVLLHGWLRLSPTFEWARVFSTLAVALTVVVLDRQGRWLGGAARALPLLAALSPTMLWAASEARGYALAGLWTALALYFFCRAWLSEAPNGAREIVAFVVAAYAAMMTFYYTGFVVAGMALAGLLVGVRRRSFFVALGALTLLMLPWGPTVLEQLRAHPDYQQALGFSDFAAWLGKSVLSMMTRFSDALENPGGQAGVIGLALLLMLVRVLSLRRRPWTRVETALAAVAVVPVACLAILRLDHVLVEHRHWMPASVGVLALVGVTLRSCETARARHLLLGGLVLVEFAGTASFARNYRGVQEWRSAVAWMRDQGYRSDDAVMVWSGEALPPLLLLVPGARGFGVPRDVSYARYKTDEQVVRSLEQVEERVTPIIRPGEVFWLIRWVTLDHVAGGEFVDAFVHTRTKVLAQIEVSGLRVQRLRLQVPRRSGS